MVFFCNMPDMLGMLACRKIFEKFILSKKPKNEEKIFLGDVMGEGVVHLSCQVACPNLDKWAVSVEKLGLLRSLVSVDKLPVELACFGRKVAC